MSSSESYNFNKERLEYIAIQIMAAIVQSDQRAYHQGQTGDPVGFAEATARDSIKYAKALIKELDKEFE